MILQELLKYNFSKDFVEGKISEHRFLSRLIERIKSDEEFRLKTQIISTEIEDLRKVTDEMYIIKIKRERAKRKSRRGFVKKLGLATAGVFAFGTKVIAPGSHPAYRIDNSIKLFEEIAKRPQLKPVRNPIFSVNANAPAIILIGDEDHANSLVKHAQLELLRKIFGLNFVGIEGWAGHEVDKKRGRQILNAAVDLIKELLKNKDYRVVGLEDENAQTPASELETLSLYGNLSVHAKELSDGLMNHKMPQNVIEIIFIFVQNAFRGSDFTSSYKSVVENSDKIIKKCEDYCYNVTRLESKEIYGRLDNYASTVSVIFQHLSEIYGIKNFDEVSLREYGAYVKRRGDLLIKSKPANVDWVTHYAFNLRDYHAVKKMLEAMKTHQQKIGIVVFGAAHTDGLIQEFLKQTNNNTSILAVQ